MVEVQAKNLQIHNRIIKDGRELIVAGIQRESSWCGNPEFWLFSLRDEEKGTEALHSIQPTEVFELVPARHMLWIDGKAATVTTLTAGEAYELAHKYRNKAHKKGVAMMIEITESTTDTHANVQQEIVYAAQINEDGGELIARFED